MKIQVFLRCAVLVLAGWITQPLQAASLDAEQHASELALKFVGHVAAAQSTQVELVTSAQLRAKLPAPQLLAIWQGLTQRYGQFASCKTARHTSQPPLISIELDCIFQSHVVPVHITVQDDAVAGIFLGQPRPLAALSAASERSVSFGQSGWLLPATIRLPDDGKPVATAVMLHGSGPQDRDGRVGQTTIFRDLAEQLARNGIATFRYEKRTRQHALKLSAQGDVTLEEEVIDDALSALRTVATRPELASTCTILLGHSLGAYLAPHVFETDRQQSIKAMVLLAPPARPVAQVALEQIEYLLTDSEQSSGAVAVLDAERQRLRKWLANSSSDTITDADMPRTFGPSAWRFFKGYDPIAVWGKHRPPVLALFAEKDYQVTQADQQAWQSAANGQPQLQVKVIKGASHVFTPSVGNPTPRQYDIPAQVVPAVSETINRFVKQYCREKT